MSTLTAFRGPRALAALGALCLASGCGGVADEVAIIFPDSEAHDAASVIAVTVFEPLLTAPDKDVPELVTCPAVGVFAPSRAGKMEAKPEGIDPDEISAIPNLGRVLSEVREPQTLPFDGDWSLSVPRVKAGDKNNPWGAVLVYIEARGNVRSSQDQGGGQVMATLLAGCFCVRTQDGSHTDHALDLQVKQSCADITSGENKQREVRLEPVVDAVFRLDPDTVQSLTAPRNQLLSPGPAVRVNANKCDDVSTQTQSCFRCEQPCNELNDRRNVPVFFSVEQPGGNSTPQTQIVLSDREGVATAQITVDDCSQPIKVRSRVVGRADPPVEFEVGCVPPVQDWECAAQQSISGRGEPLGITTIPGENGQPDHVAILYDEGNKASVEVLNPEVGTSTTWHFASGEMGRALYGFYYDLGTPGGASPREPALAVMTSKIGASGRAEARLYLFRWTGDHLVPHQSPLAPFDKPCTKWNCDKYPQSMINNGESCSAVLNETCSDLNADRACTCDADGNNCVTPPMQTTCGCGCACRVTLDFQTQVTMVSADLDGDRKADLAIGTSSDLPISFYYSRQAQGGALYAEGGCNCGRFGQSPSTFALLDMGGSTQGDAAGPLDMVLGAPGGAFVRYGAAGTQGASIISCGSAGRFGELVPVRDLAAGHFQCARSASGSCSPFDDLVLVAAKSLGGGSLDDPGTIRVVYGASSDLIDEGLFDRPGATLELVPMPAPGQTEPRDPRAVKVGDFNCDGLDDVSVLFGTSEEVHVWLSGGQRGLGETASPILLSKCGSASGKCGVLKQFTIADLDGDGAKEVFVICSPSSDPKLRRYRPGPRCP